MTLNTISSGSGKWIIFLILALIVVLFFALGLHHHVTLAQLKSRQHALDLLYAKHTGTFIALYMAVYILTAALSLPGAAVLTIAGGAIFGLWIGTLIVSFSSTIGATLAFLLSRYLFRDYVQKRYAGKLKTVNSGISKDGGFYLFTLRLVPIFPFFIINLAMGLTPIGTGAFYLISQIGMLPGTMVYVNAGTQLAKIHSTASILSPDLILSLALLGFFPWIAKAVAGILKKRRIMSAYRRPKKFDYNLVVIGAGSAGLVTAYIAAAVRARVALIEKNRMGGDCLYTGCVPSKALIRSAKMLFDARRSSVFGIKQTRVDYEFSEIMERVQRMISKIEPHDSSERYTRLGVDCITGEARIVSPYEVAVNGKTITTRSIVIATGASPFVPPIPGLEQAGYLTSDTVWSLRECPKRLVVMGGGPIGCELAQTFSRLGAKVTLVEMAQQILGREDRDVANMVRQQFEAEGIAVLTGHRAIEVRTENGQKMLISRKEGRSVDIVFDEILVAVGRKSVVKGLGLAQLGIELNKNSTIQTDAFLRTRIPTIFCAGDVAGPYQFTHVAAHQAWFAAVNALFGRLKKFKVDYRVIPRATFTDPEVACVGLNETDAKEKGIDYELTTYDMDDLDRAIVDSDDRGIVKVLTVPGSDKILGATVVGPHAGDILSEYVLAMKHGLGLNKILGTVHIYPTLAEAGKYAAGNWKKSHAPASLLKWLSRFHDWMRK